VWRLIVLWKRSFNVGVDQRDQSDFACECENSQ
jgi:hypothetical protein